MITKNVDGKNTRTTTTTDKDTHSFFKQKTIMKKQDSEKTLDFYTGDSNTERITDLDRIKGLFK